MRAWYVALVGIMVGCAETGNGSFASVEQPAQCVAGQTQACTCANGSAGMQRCEAQWTACECAVDNPPDVNNPPPLSTVDASIGDNPDPPQNDSCKPGFYLGTYNCEISLFGFPAPLDGDVSFNLSVNEDMVDGECPPSEEFCPDLVISENSGTLFGLAGLVGFETLLNGALDCETGEFRAMGVDGRYGNAVSMDPNDPDALWTVEDPPLGNFEGELAGTQKPGTGGAADVIEGMWNLRDITITDLSCEGPFHVELQP